MHDEELLVASIDRVFELDVRHRLLGERSADEEIAIALDVMDRHAGIAQLPEAIEHRSDGWRIELRIGDDEVKQIAVEVQRARLQRGEPVEPRDDRPFAPGREADMRVADDEDLTGRNHSALFRLARGSSRYCDSIFSTRSAGMSRGRTI